MYSQVANEGGKLRDSLKEHKIVDLTLVHLRQNNKNTEVHVPLTWLFRREINSHLQTINLFNFSNFSNNFFLFLFI